MPDRVTTDDLALPPGYIWVRTKSAYWTSRGRLVHVHDTRTDQKVCDTHAQAGSFRPVDPDVYPDPLDVCHRCTTKPTVQRFLELQRVTP